MENTNRLSLESSPYLLQHAHNPVDWYPWGEAALKRAQSENKLLLISIGYSACHWCHVMERESFEDNETAELMNQHFVCIKVDREERPDIDQVYMHAVQLISGQGGWPLNCFALPDGRPIYGGTYFRKEQWQDILQKLAQLYQQDPAKTEKYAEQLTKGLQQKEWVGKDLGGEKSPISVGELDKAYKAWEFQFDLDEGGTERSPKFPLPNNWLFLLRYGLWAENSALKQVQLTLEKMAYGGIYDHLGGGFARYSTDSLWKAPHFEKMLYDNAQLVELYAEAYGTFKNLEDQGDAETSKMYLQVVRETIDFIERELTSPEGVFYSALDADSEGIEGKFYVWEKAELEKLLGDDFPLFRDAFNVNATGYWEEGQYILLRKKSDKALADDAGLELNEWMTKITKCKSLLFAERAKRIRPGLDDKSLLSWNALMDKGLIVAFIHTGEKKYLDLAIRNMEFFIEKGRQVDGGLYHSYKAGRFSINGFLEDYAFFIDALISLYQATFTEKWLHLAKELTEYVLQHFGDTDSGFFFFTSDLDPPLVARKFEVMDNVMPGSNSVMSKNLFYLGNYFGLNSYLDQAQRMLSQVKGSLLQYGSGYSNWAILALHYAYPFQEVVLSGPGVLEGKGQLHRSLEAKWLFNLLWAGTESSSILPILQNRFPEETSDKGEKGHAESLTYYICRNRICDLPTQVQSEAGQKISNAKMLI